MRLYYHCFLYHYSFSKNRLTFFSNDPLKDELRSLVSSTVVTSLEGSAGGGSPPPEPAVVAGADWSKVAENSRWDDLWPSVRFF